MRLSKGNLSWKGCWTCGFHKRVVISWTPGWLFDCVT